MLNAKTLTRTKIQEHIKSMAKKNFYYEAILKKVNDLPTKSKEDFWNNLEAKKFTSIVDLDIYLEN